jgi:hypothetical protein
MIAVIWLLLGVVLFTGVLVIWSEIDRRRKQ